MNQDQARRMAEEALRDCVWFPTLDKGMLMRVNDAEEAIVAALVKLTHGQEPVALLQNGILVSSSLPVGYTGPLYTHPIPSQQETSPAVAAEPDVMYRLTRNINGSWIPASEFTTSCDESWRELAKSAPQEWCIQRRIAAARLKDGFKQAFSNWPATSPIHSQQEGEIVVTKNQTGQIVAVTRQDSEGRILEVVAESNPEGRKPLTFEQVEACFPDGATTNEHGQCVCSAQWLHDFAQAIHNIKEQCK